MARDKPAASLAPAAVQVAASVRIHGAPVASSFRATVSVAASVNLHGASPCHRSKLLTQSPSPVASIKAFDTVLCWLGNSLAVFPDRLLKAGLRTVKRLNLSSWTQRVDSQNQNCGWNAVFDLYF